MSYGRERWPRPAPHGARRLLPPETHDVTLHQILVHVAAGTWRHAGHAGIIRELIDGATGLTAKNSNVPSKDEAWWNDYRDRIDRAAREAAARKGPVTNCPASG